MTATPANKSKSSASRGTQFRDRVLEKFTLEMSELEVLDEIVGLLDEIDALKKAIDLDGVTVTGSTGQTRTHPGLNDIRQHRLALQRLLAALGLPDEDDNSMKSPAQLRSSQGNRARWGGPRG